MAELQPFWRDGACAICWATRKYNMECHFASTSRNWSFFGFAGGKLLSRHVNGTEVWVKDSEDYYRTKHAYY